MQPSKSTVDYTMELNRLFLKNPVTDGMPTSTPNQPAFYHATNKAHYQPAFSDSTTKARYQPAFNDSTPKAHYQPAFSHRTSNYSSSSTDSYSPDTFPELSFRSEQRGPETSRPLETPFAIARRPIVGRKIIASTEKPVEQNIPEERYYEKRANTPMSPITFFVGPNTPPNIKEQRYTKNAFYELFPGENRGFEFKTPVKTPSVYSNMSPSSPMSQNSPVNSNYGMLTPPRYTTPFILGANSPMSGVNSSNVGANSPMSIGANSPMNFGAGTSGFQHGSQKMCTFCRKNGETPLVYMTHTVKEKRGTRNVVTCPILRSHVCSICGVSGDNAHTITYCPVLRSNNNGVPLKSTTITLKNTRIKSNGRRRY